ncbi:DUF6193 family natural product biosynthesis protein [Streptomyces sp. t39]|uniref:DUF6193 family natural product biosynthesis protein n=1 Tax=Streptomyces sp. t39 TaxID=1828156 RepID=UPI0011CD779D|nr:DUF6193 family natural product biosynthesis protein [Streptomyces sp. t39]TXS56985.1 hypothetical protein EAO77_13410 [Streptomyces sp. t39]
MSAIDPGLYPDVAAMGGLTDAIASVARRREADVGEPVDPVSASGADSVTAVTESGRGTLRVSLATESRTFFLGIHERRFVWAEGATEELDSLVDAIAAWRGGMPVDDFAARFPFMTPGRLARAREAGDVTRAQWDWLRTAEVHADERALVTAFHEDGRFHRFFPVLTHGVLRLGLDGGDPEAGAIAVAPEDKAYRVTDTRSSGPGEVAASPAEAVEAAARRLTDD